MALFFVFISGFSSQDWPMSSSSTCVVSQEEKGRCIETAVEEQLVTLVTFGQVSGLLRRKGLNCL